jgi:hypothetical protein
MTKYRVTMTNNRGKRLATDWTTEDKWRAQRYADETNENYHKANARVVKDSERVRRMIP